MRQESNVGSKRIISNIEELHKLVQKTAEKPEIINEPVRQHKTSPKPTAKSCPPYVPPKRKTEYQGKTQVLYVADSVGRNVEFPKVENEVGCIIKTAKAYSSDYDEAATWPLQNFTKVVKDELDIKSYDCLVMSAPTVDITNLDTSNLRQSDNTAVYQQSVWSSCQNIFNVAQQSLNDYPGLKKVIVMEHSPRFDAENVDPIGLKPALARYASNVYNQLWLDSCHKNKIFIKSHTMNISNGVHEDVFRNVKTNNYDGVHFYGKAGRKAYTKSVGTILRNCISSGNQSKTPQEVTPQDYHKQKCPQALYQNKQKKNLSRQNPTVQVSNMFSPLESFQGNL